MTHEEKNKQIAKPDNPHAPMQITPAAKSKIAEILDIISISLILLSLFFNQLKNNSNIFAVVNIAPAAVNQNWTIEFMSSISLLLFTMSCLVRYLPGYLADIIQSLKG
ncbi:hypothetical protein Q4563_08120 [Gilvimarinus sp. 1_MG-2023]|nr:hypothetical protein [Gilvimarinus sp. 1_MG-2023]